MEYERLADPFYCQLLRSSSYTIFNYCFAKRFLVCYNIYMNTLILSQTIFYISASLAIIILGILFAITTYHIICIARHLNKIANNIDEATDTMKENIKEIIEKLSVLPIISYLFNKKRSGKSENKDKK